MTIEDIYRLSKVETETELNSIIFYAIKDGKLDLNTFLEYQQITQSDIRDSMENSYLDQ